jgi:VIT1/CCC1 family predicted Fe2+/Mn2+ transporter
MPRTPHVERHFAGGARVRDAVLGLSDGLTVPFALAAGLSGAVVASRIVVTAGLAEIAAGSIAMGLGGYLAARSDAEHYASERRREENEVRDKAEVEADEVRQVFRSYGLSDHETQPLVDALRKRPQAWIDFMMRFELGLERPEPNAAVRSAGTIALSYVVGGLVPLAPYIAMRDARAALEVSIAVTMAALAVFGWIKGRLTGARPARSAAQTVLIGGLAAAAAYSLARALS